MGLETLLPAALALVHDGNASLSHVLATLTAAPARILGLPTGTLTKGAPADLVLIDPDEPFVVEPPSCSPAPATPPLTAANSRAGRRRPLSAASRFSTRDRFSPRRPGIVPAMDWHCC